MNEDIDFKDLFGHLPSPYMILDRELRFVHANDAYLQVTGSRRENILGKYVFDAFPEKNERRALFEDAFRRAVAGESVTIVRQRFDIPRPAAEGGGMRQIIWTTYQIPVRNHAGEVVGMLQKALDVTSEVHAERDRDTVLREFDHRMKNLLAKVSAICSLTAREEKDLPVFLDKFRQRLTALSRTQSLLLRSNDEARIEDLLKAELEPFGAAGARAAISGPDLMLSGTTAQTLGMAFHELSTNAAKYGALYHEDGAIRVAWDFTPDERSLVLDWDETGFAAQPPQAQGFGSIIIERLVPDETGGRVERWFDDDGHRVRFTMPLGGLRNAPPA